MVKFIARIAATALLAGVSTQAIAESDGWSISESSGKVFLQRNGQSMAAKRGADVRPGDAILTGPGGRAVLVHGLDFVTVASNARLRIPAEKQDSLLTRIVQEVGNAIFRIEKRGTPHFTVDTPYLAAVVKGTTFSITVGPADTALQVTEGVVEVSTTDGGARELVRPGSVAMIASGDRYRLAISGDNAQVIDSPLRQQDSVSTSPAPSTVENAPPQPTTQEAPAGASDAAGSSNIANGGGVGTTITAFKPAELADRSAGGQSTVFIEAVISSKPVDMGKTTNGLISGSSPVQLAVATASPSSIARPPKIGGPDAFNKGGSTAPAPETDKISQLTNEIRPEPAKLPATDIMPAKGTEDKPAKDDDAKGKDDKPAKDDDTKGKDDKPAKDDDTKGKDDKPAKDDDAKGKDDKPAKDDDIKGKDDKPAKDDDAKGKDDKPAKDDDIKGKDDKPAKDDDIKGKDDNPAKDDDIKGKDDKPAKDDDAKGKDDNPAKDDDTKGNDDKPAKDDDAKGKDDNPAKDDDTKGKDDKPAKDDDTKGKDDKPAKDDDAKGKDDKPAKDDDIKGKDDKPAKDDDAKGKDDKPAKGDDGKAAGD